MNYTEREQTLFTHVGKSESICGSRIADMDFTHEFEFPFAVSMQDNIFAHVVDHSQHNGSLFRVASATGRGGSILPDFSFQYVGNNPALFSNIYAKGFGLGNYEAAVSGSGMDPQDKNLRKWWISQGMPSYFMYKYNEATGVTTYKDAYMDAIQSHVIHDIGIRTRLPILTYELTALPLSFGQLHQVKDLEWEGWVFDRDSGKIPVLSLWARRYAQTFRDIDDILKQAEAKGTEQTVVRHVIDSMMAHMAIDTDPTMKNIGHEYLKARELSVGNTALLQLEKEGFINMARLYAKQMILFKKYGIYHGMLTDHNSNLLVEFSDNSHIYFSNPKSDARRDISQRHATNVRSLQFILESFITRVYSAKGSMILAQSMKELVIGEYYDMYGSLLERAKLLFT